MTKNYNELVNYLKSKNNINNLEDLIKIKNVVLTEEIFREWLVRVFGVNRLIPSHFNTSYIGEFSDYNYINNGLGGPTHLKKFIEYIWKDKLYIEDNIFIRYISNPQNKIQNLLYDNQFDVIKHEVNVLTNPSTKTMGNISNLNLNWYILNTIIKEYTINDINTLDDIRSEDLKDTLRVMQPAIVPGYKTTKELIINSRLDNSIYANSKYLLYSERIHTLNNVLYNNKQNCLDIHLDYIYDVLHTNRYDQYTNITTDNQFHIENFDKSRLASSTIKKSEMSDLNRITYDEELKEIKNSIDNNVSLLLTNIGPKLEYGIDVKAYYSKEEITYAENIKNSILNTLGTNDPDKKYYANDYVIMDDILNTSIEEILSSDLNETSGTDTTDDRSVYDRLLAILGKTSKLTFDTFKSIQVLDRIPSNELDLNKAIEVIDKMYTKPLDRINDINQLINLKYLYYSKWKAKTSDDNMLSDELAATIYNSMVEEFTNNNISDEDKNTILNNSLYNYTTWRSPNSTSSNSSAYTNIMKNIKGYKSYLMLYKGYLDLLNDDGNSTLEEYRSVMNKLEEVINRDNSIEYKEFLAYKYLYENISNKDNIDYDEMKVVYEYIKNKEGYGVELANKIIDKFKNKTRFRYNKDEFYNNYAIINLNNYNNTPIHRFEIGKRRNFHELDKWFTYHNKPTSEKGVMGRDLWLFLNEYTIKKDNDPQPEKIAAYINNAYNSDMFYRKFHGKKWIDVFRNFYPVNIIPTEVMDRVLHLIGSVMRDTTVIKPEEKYSLIIASILSNATVSDIDSPNIRKYGIKPNTVLYKYKERGLMIYTPYIMKNEREWIKEREKLIKMEETDARLVIMISYGERYDETPFNQYYVIYPTHYQYQAYMRHKALLPHLNDNLHYTRFTDEENNRYYGHNMLAWWDPNLDRAYDVYSVNRDHLMVTYDEDLDFTNNMPPELKKFLRDDLKRLIVGDINTPIPGLIE